jgi:mannose-1-phosphate guanylyltransferase
VSGLNAAAPIVVCNEAHRFLVAEQLRTIDATAQAILLEPVGRNTAPAIALAARRDGRSREAPIHCCSSFPLIT